MAKRKTISQTSKDDHVERFKRLADYLQQSRRNRRISVRKAAQLSNLPESTVRALENPRRSTLPSSNVVGLYTVYASALDVPTSRVRKMVGEETESKPHFAVPKLPRLKSTVVFSNIGVMLAVSLVALIVLGYAAWQGFGLVSKPELTVRFPDQAFLVVDGSSIEVRGSADREATVLVNGEPTTVQANSGEFTQTVFLQEGYNYITVEAVNSFSTTTVEQFVVIYEPATQTAYMVPIRI